MYPIALFASLFLIVQSELQNVKDKWISLFPVTATIYVQRVAEIRNNWLPSEITNSMEESSLRCL